MNKENVLRHIPLFENISQESRAALADISIPKTVKKKESLFWEGDKGLTLYILVKGNIRLFKTTPEGKEVVIKVVKPGDMFAEVVLFEQNRYPVSAVALKESLVFMISKHQFTCLLENERFAGARDQYLETIKRDPRHRNAYNNLVNLYLVTRKLEKSLYYLDMAEKNNVPVNPRLKQAVRNASEK